MRRFVKIVAVLFMCSLTITLVTDEGKTADRLNRGATGPLNATYLIEGKAVGLMHGRSEWPAAPGSAIKTRTAVMGQTVYGDMDSDGDEDAVVLFTHDPGGSGTFYYVAVAINANGRYQGTNAVLLGDQIAPMNIGLRSGAVVVNYADRHPEEPMSDKPSVQQTAVLSLENDHLFEITPIGEKDNIAEGWVTIGHEVRSFEPCGRNTPLWLMGQSPAIKEIIAAYRQALPNEKTYRPMFMVLAGKRVEPPAEGFGADYETAFLATYLVRVALGANCARETFDIESPIRDRQEITFDISTLDEDGLFGPPGRKRALAYEFCIPDTVWNRTEVEQFDPTVEFFAESPGRIGCGKDESLCIGTTHQQDFATILRRLAELATVQRI